MRLAIKLVTELHESDLANNFLLAYSRRLEKLETRRLKRNASNISMRAISINLIQKAIRAYRRRSRRGLEFG